MKIYISGPMTGLQYNNYPAFNYVDRLLKQQGYDTFNPAAIKGDDNWTWEDYMRPCVKAIPECTHIYMLDNWEKSRGARVEFDIAMTLGLEVMYQTGVD